MKLHNVIRNHKLFENYSKPIMTLITEGLVRINGKVKRKNNDVVIERDTVEILLNNQWVELEQEIRRTIVLIYKPVGYLCTHRDNFDRPKIYDLVDEEFRSLRSAGRLDQDSEGLLVLTDDGYYLFSLTSPKFPCKKTYLVGLKELLTQDMIDFSFSGEFVIHRDEEKQVLRSVEIQRTTEKVLNEFEYLGLDKGLSWYEFVLVEGKYNQIRKMCELYNNPVQRLVRIQHADFRLTQEIYDAQWKVLSRK